MVEVDPVGSACTGPSKSFGGRFRFAGVTTLG